MQILLANFILCLAHARCSQTSVITEILLRNTEETNQYFYGPFPNLWFWLPAQVTERNHQWCLPEQKIMNLRHETSWLNHHSGFVVGCFLQTKISNVHPPATMAKYRSCLLINRLKYYRFNALHERRVKQRETPPSRSLQLLLKCIFYWIMHLTKPHVFDIYSYVFFRLNWLVVNNYFNKLRATYQLNAVRMLVGCHVTTLLIVKSSCSHSNFITLRSSWSSVLESIAELSVFQFPIHTFFPSEHLKAGAFCWVYVTNKSFACSWNIKRGVRLGTSAEGVDSGQHSYYGRQNRRMEIWLSPKHRLPCCMLR